MTKQFVHEPISLGYGDLNVIEGIQRLYETPAGVKYPSMTTILSVREKDYLQAWRNRVGDAEADRVCHHGVTRGSALHSLAEKYINNEEVDFRNMMPHVKQSFGVVKRILDEHVDRIIMQEAALFSDYLGVAGRVDLIGYYDGILSIIDFKTSKSARTEEDIDSYFLQVSGYAAMFYERTGIAIKQGVIIMVVDFSPKPLIFKFGTYEWLPELVKTIALYNAK